MFAFYFPLLFLLLLSPSFSSPFSTPSSPYLSPLVFDPHFYLTTYGDLLLAGLKTEKDAENHWLTFGLKEGRVATSFFHTVQYLQLNPDVRKVVGDKNYAGAAQHWVEHGWSEGREGVHEAGGEGLFSLGGRRKQLDDIDIVYATYTPRFAGAVHSVMYRHKEIANAYDHGRELQYAFQLANRGECYNPTEAGGKYDLLNWNSSSHLISVSLNSSRLTTVSQPAYWMLPGSSEPGCGKAYNPTVVSNWTMTKVVDLQPFSSMKHVSRWTMSVTAPETIVPFQTECPTLYANGDISEVYTYDPLTKKLTDITSGPSAGEDPTPIILSSPDGQYAAGCYAPWITGSGGSAYAHFRFPGGPWVAQTFKWSLVYRTSKVTIGQFLEFVSYVIVGTRQEVMDDMTTLAKQLKIEGNE